MLTGGVVTIYVGPKRKEYQVHRSLLASHEYWRKFLDSKLAEDSRIVHLPDQYPATWDLFINWLYRGKLKDICEENEDVATDQAIQYINLYTTAEHWAILALQNNIMDKLHAWEALLWGWFPSYSIHHVYEHNPNGSPLRSYLVDSFLAEGSLCGKNLKSELDYGNHEFAVECFEALMQLTPKSKLRAPDRKTACTYHKHENGKKCCK